MQLAIEHDHVPGRLWMCVVCILTFSFAWQLQPINGSYRVVAKCSAQGHKHREYPTLQTMLQQKRKRRYCKVHKQPAHDHMSIAWRPLAEIHYGEYLSTRLGGSVARSWTALQTCRSSRQWGKGADTTAAAQRTYTHKQNPAMKQLHCHLTKSDAYNSHLHKRWLWKSAQKQNCPGGF